MDTDVHLKVLGTSSLMVLCAQAHMSLADAQYFLCSGGTYDSHHVRRRLEEALGRLPASEDAQVGGHAVLDAPRYVRAAMARLSTAYAFVASSLNHYIDGKPRTGSDMSRRALAYVGEARELVERALAALDG